MEVKTYFKPEKVKLSKAQFKKLAIKCFERDSYTCRWCHRQYQVEQHGLSAHHIKLKSRSGGDTLENIVSLCLFPCHRDVTDGKIPNNFKN